MYYLTSLLGTKKVKAAYTDMRGIATNGFRLVDVPPSVRISEGASLTPEFTYSDLLQQKAEGILALNPEFSSVLYSDLSDASIIDAANSQGSGWGSSGVYWVHGAASALRTVVMPLVSPASRFLVTWDIHEVSYEPNEDGFVVKTATPVDPDIISVTLSSGAGNPAITMYNDTPTTMTAGQDLVLEFRGSSTIRYYIGGFVILY